MRKGQQQQQLSYLGTPKRSWSCQNIKSLTNCRIRMLLLCCRYIFFLIFKNLFQKFRIDGTILCRKHMAIYKMASPSSQEIFIYYF